MRKLLGMVVAGVGLVAGACADEIKLSDTFIDASNWSLDQSWKLTDDGQMRGSGDGGSFLFLKDKNTAGEITFESDITPLEAKNKGWKAVGLAIFQDGNNFWSLTLVEAPDNFKPPKFHFVELREMKNGKWGGADNKASKIGPLNWEYNTTYRMKMAMDANGISGQVLDKDGKVLSEVKYKFTGDAVKIGSPALRDAGMTANFDNIEINGK